jgi:tetratricopeptide (TPR) repeat protein
MDLYFQGMACVNKGPTTESLTQARRFFERAVALDPGNIDARVGTADVDVYVGQGHFSEDRAARLATAEATLIKVLSSAPDHARAHCLLGSIQIYTNRALQGIAECERALALDLNYTFAHAAIGFAKFITGRAEETESHVAQALRLNPRGAGVHVWMLFAGIAKLALGADEEAIAWFRRCLETNRNLPLPYFSLGAALAHAGRMDEARAAVQAGLAFDPTFTIARFRAGAMGDHPVYLAQRERFCDSMRKAGVPEG